jgi:hypothetical protein
MIFLLQALLVPWLIGFFLLSLFPVAWGRPFKVFLSLGVGFGIVSCVYFLDPRKSWTPLVEYAALAVLIALNVWWRQKPSLDTSAEAAGTSARATVSLNLASQEKPFWALVAAFLAAVALSGTFLVLHLTKYAHGGQEAWVTWNLVARFLYRSGDKWGEALSQLYSRFHADYPLLVPTLVARCWQYMGRESVLAPILIAVLFTAGTVGLLFSALLMLRGKSQALVGALVLASTPLFVASGADQYADVPLAFFLLATIVLLYLEDRFVENNWSYGALAGITAGLAGWTKNEGLLFIAIIVLVRLAVGAATKRVKTILPFLAGLAPLLLLIFYFRYRFAAAWLFGPAPDYGRLAAAFVLELLGFGGWYFSPVLLLAIYGLCLGAKLDQRDKPILWTAAAVLVLMAAGSGFLSRVAVSRVILQLWPSLLFVYFLVIRPPERLPLVPEKRREKGKKRNAPSSVRVK